MGNNYGSWSGGAPGEDILNDPRYWGIEDDGPEPEDEEESEEVPLSEATLIAGVELGQAPNRYRVEKHRIGFIRGVAMSPIYILIDTDGEQWMYQYFNGVINELTRDKTLDLDPDEYAALYALQEAK